MHSGPKLVTPTHLNPVFFLIVEIRTPEDLKRTLISTQLIRPDQWMAAENELSSNGTVTEFLEVLERRQALTNLQRARVAKGDLDGLVLGNYKLMYRNASGSFARVYRAETVDSQKTVALKLLRDRWAVDPEAVASFHREARICQKFKHPNIVPIYDVGTSGRFHYFTMEFVEGGNLRDFMNIRKSLSPAEASQCTYEICSGLNYALSMDATHRDLKLTNVLMSSDGVAKLVDFGLAGNEAAAPGADDVHRALEYASLERGTNARRNDPRSDIFFAGAMFYELLSGVPAWARTRDREERKQFSRYTQTPPVETIVDGIPEDVSKVVRTMMQVNPGDRYQTYTDVIGDLKDALTAMGEWRGGSDTEIEMAAVPKRDFRLLVVDSVSKRIKALTEYFSRHGFNTAFRKTPEAAFSILKSETPPDGVLILADNFTNETIDSFPQMQAWGRKLQVACLAVFPSDSRELVDSKIRSTRYGATAFQPTTLREIREHFQNVSS